MKTAYPLHSNPVEIRLYSNIPFDNTYKHHSLISEKFSYNGVGIYSNSQKVAKERFIDRSNWALFGHPYYYPRYNISGEYNFDFSNGLVGSVVLELTPEQTNANYMRVKVGDTINGYEYYYYFITGISQINVDTYRLSLELDVIMTYQDEFLEGMSNIPVFTARKHCHRYTDDGIKPYSSDFKTGEDVFTGIKPSIIENTYQLEYDLKPLKDIKDVIWLYICCDAIEDSVGGDFDAFTCQGVVYPFSTLVLPINCGIKVKDSNDQDYSSFSPATIRQCVRNLINEGKFHGAKLSHYSPFANGGNLDMTTIDNDTFVVIHAGQSTAKTTPFNYMILGVGDSGVAPSHTDRNWFITKEPDLLYSGDAITTAMNRGALLITELNHVTYSQHLPSSFNTQFDNTQAPSVVSNRYLDPKLLFSPFKKYILMAKYSEGLELYPELLFSEYTTINSELDYGYFTFNSITTPFIGDMSVYTYLKPYTISGEEVWKDYGINRVGLSGTMNYTMPVGENALDVFNATQSNAFYQSKVASGITGGLSIVGGIASIAVGSGMTVGSSGALSPMGMGLVASGATAIAGGVASIANNIKSTTAKIEDLKNTPDNVNIAGSTFIADYALNNNYILPYIAVYTISSVMKENANDYFYNYGYQVARECYFNTELLYTPESHKTDNNLFGRTIFNFIQTNDDITNKINYDMPLIIKQKFNSILNNGITLWSWFGFDELWGTGIMPILALRLDRWFLKCTLDNTEYKQ